MQKKGELTGFLKGLSYSKNMSDLSLTVMLQKAIETESYKKDGFANADNFCLAVTNKTYDTHNKKWKNLKSLGAEVISILVSLNVSIRDARIIEHALVEDNQSGKKGIRIDDKIIPFEEEKKDEIQTTIDLLKERRDAAKKEADAIRKKMEGLDKEHKKEVEAITKEMDALRARLEADTPEMLLKVIKELDEHLTKFERAAQVVFNKKVLELDNAKTHVAITNIIDDMRSRALSLGQRWDAFITSDEAMQELGGEK